MDFIPPGDPFFPLQQSNELFFQSRSPAGQQYTDPQQDTLCIMAVLDCDDETCNENKKKKVTHREVERQRRQEMAGLYASLRTLLPIEYLKGKRSISDRMNEAANYIKDLRNGIQELHNKRDELRKMPNSRNCLPDNVIVRPCGGGVEVVINSGLRNGEFPLSMVIKELVDLGFIVVGCVSTAVNQRSLHTVQSEVSDLTTVDLSGLQLKLSNLIASSSSSLDNFSYTTMI
ncbi:hypothetical protein NE237_011720 [Protea cynaroides]|uniref:BHLH domain-containing protein n=1 Tax=Protea cynaroides TaxID=273540 RepID=A0A9Q0GVH4_9MAGN|nr:hypothetical protein NE237_011720 [Protea cynaroides]